MTTAQPPVRVDFVHTGPAIDLSWQNRVEPTEVEHLQAGEPTDVAWLHVTAPVQTMLTGDGHRVWVGDVVPTVVPGAQVGDLYLHSETGTLYRLD